MPTNNATRHPGRFLRLLSCCVAVATIWACGPVYIPVPPPVTETTFTKAPLTDSSGAEFWITSGAINPNAANAIFNIFDEQQNAGVIAGANADGSYQAPPMQGTVGDHVLINYQDSHGDLSLSACVLLSELRPFAATCPRCGRESRNSWSLARSRIVCLGVSIAVTTTDRRKPSPDLVSGSSPGGLDNPGD